MEVPELRLLDDTREPVLSSNLKQTRLKTLKIKDI